VNGVTWTEDGVSLVTLGHDGKLRTWDLATGRNTLVCVAQPFPSAWKLMMVAMIDKL
jgi:WD40 repeat protein